LQGKQKVEEVKIDWANFTPWFTLAGGAPIGLATTILILFNGRIAGDGPRSAPASLLACGLARMAAFEFSERLSCKR
jgi:hypothetical protein